LRRALDRLLDRTDDLIREARALPGLVRDWRLRCETSVIVVVAERLSARLRREDPLQKHVKLGKAAFGAGALVGIGRVLRA
jgi:hypothetical protein